ncbi:unnamed protein product [Danaus chrysippus]|uniref:(African queen) hypothetical protein n=1 Tax=Danaus chrysippus TaxID=151541 RepID=A0A8J2QNV4_9NEOP|nr:unnamed protein product [Danaus chrysippus]
MAQRAFASTDGTRTTAQIVANYPPDPGPDSFPGIVLACAGGKPPPEPGHPVPREASQPARKPPHERQCGMLVPIRLVIQYQLYLSYVYVYNFTLTV